MQFLEYLGETTPTFPCEAFYFLFYIYRFIYLA